MRKGVDPGDPQQLCLGAKTVETHVRIIFSTLERLGPADGRLLRRHG
ncbi:MAG: hypothetical protein JF886_11765 [Candidatus Dormibacteraeota bacterium]|uniref:Uncharacterized protein n=1 Tax=Candidatus Aeolococcus gillhamiae TaxID=3127015 RepID=A0A934JTN7_9BACT|nr:hypothetical protein [Candidatus Dormibacteraeota bacterium]